MVGPAASQNVYHNKQTAAQTTPGGHGLALGDVTPPSMSQVGPQGPLTAGWRWRAFRGDFSLKCEVSWALLPTSSEWCRQALRGELFFPDSVIWYLRAGKWWNLLRIYSLAASDRLPLWKFHRGLKSEYIFREVWVDAWKSPHTPSKLPIMYHPTPRYVWTSTAEHLDSVKLWGFVSVRSPDLFLTRL